MKNWQTLIGWKHGQVVGLGLAMMFVVAGCKPTGAATRSEKPASAPETPVFALGEEKLETSIRVPGELVSFERVDLYAKMSSFVQRVLVDVGSEVKQGQLLATLEAPELRSQLAEAESKLQAQEALYIASKASYDRLVQTSKTPGTVSPHDLEQAEARTNAERARLEAAKAAKQAVAALSSYLEMRAPFGAVVTARNVSPGAYVGPAGRGSEAPLFTLQQQSRLRLVVSVPEARGSRLAVGADVSFTVRSRPGERFVAKVSRLAGAVDARLRAERVEMNVDNSDARLLPGTVADVTLPLTAGSMRLVIPKAALIDSTRGTFVVRVAEQKAQWVRVDVGQEHDGKVEIFGDVRRGDLLVARASEELRDGAAIERTAPVKL